KARGERALAGWQGPLDHTGSERYLGTQRDGVDRGARPSRARRRQLGGDVVDVVEHEADVVDRIPVDPPRDARGAAAEDAARGRLRNAARGLAVEVDIGIARGHLPRS